MSSSAGESRIKEFLETVEQFLERAKKYRREQREWKERMESYLLELEECEDDKKALRNDLQQLKLQFSDFAGQMERRFKNIREASQSLSRTPQDDG